MLFVAPPPGGPGAAVASCAPFSPAMPQGPASEAPSFSSPRSSSPMLSSTARATARPSAESPELSESPSALCFTSPAVCSRLFWRRRDLKKSQQQVPEEFGTPLSPFSIQLSPRSLWPDRFMSRAPLPSRSRSRKIEIARARVLVYCARASMGRSMLLRDALVVAWLVATCCLAPTAADGAAFRDVTLSLRLPPPPPLTAGRADISWLGRVPGPRSRGGAVE